MSTKQKTRREYITIEGIDPVKGKLMQILISHERLHNICTRSMGQVLEAGEFVQLILKKPLAIFEGLRSDKDEPKRRGYGWRCYCGIPPYAYNKDGHIIPVWPNEVFLVFVNSEKVAYLWYWSKCDPEDKNLPEDYKIRFKKRLI